jgi:DNA-binding MarR family transcriptional regulator
VGRAHGAGVEVHEHLAAHGHTTIHRWLGYVIKALEERPLNVRELADHLRMTPAGAIKVIDEVVAAGYIERIADPSDARVRRLALTDQGRDLVATSHRFHRRFEERLAAALGPRRVATTRAVLTELVVDRHGDVPVAAALRPF